MDSSEKMTSQWLAVYSGHNSFDVGHQFEVVTKFHRRTTPKELEQEPTIEWQKSLIGTVREINYHGKDLQRTGGFIGCAIRVEFASDPGNLAGLSLGSMDDPERAVVWNEIRI